MTTVSYRIHPTLALKGLREVSPYPQLVLSKTQLSQKLMEKNIGFMVYSFISNCNCNTELWIVGSYVILLRIGGQHRVLAEPVKSTLMVSALCEIKT